MKNIYDFLKNLKNEKRVKECQLLIVNDDRQAQIASDIVAYLGFKSFVLSDFRANFGDDLLSFSTELQDITKVLNSYYNYKKQDKILISPIRTISYALPKEKCFDSFTINFADTEAVLVTQSGADRGRFVLLFQHQDPNQTGQSSPIRGTAPTKVASCR